MLFFLNCLQLRTTNELLGFVRKISTYIKKRLNGILLLRILIMSTKGKKISSLSFKLESKREREERVAWKLEKTHPLTLVLF